MLAENTRKKKGYEAVIKACGGNQSELARICGIKPQSVQDWAERGMIPHQRVLQIEKKLGIHRSIQRPDLYPPETVEEGMA